MTPHSPHSGAAAGPTAKMMQVKVLYSFDDDNKTNCLARCPQPLHVQTAFIDSTTQIGIIELRACIEAILEGSPELTGKMDRDFTVYAYDYSEYETPLVGQGMLSRILHSTSPTPDAPAESSQTMVTGRVCKNMMGLFKQGGLSETLEVKLRLVPVPKAVENQYQDYMQKYRDANLQAAQSFNGDNWSEFLRANPGIGLASPSASSNMLEHHQSAQMGGFAHAMHSPAAMSQDARSPFSHNSPTPWDTNQASCQQHSGASSRPVTPPKAVQHRPSMSRPSSRNSVRAAVSITAPAPLRRQSTTLSSVEADPQSQDSSNFGQEGARKRARVEQTDWHGPSSFGSKRDSLRIAASTAASIRSQGPAATSHPSTTEIAAAEVGPRPPTPIATRSFRGDLPRLHTAARDRPTYASPYAMDADVLESSLSMASSPPRNQRADSIMSTPFDMPSSPPIGPQSGTPMMSSPQLPPLADVDSGFASGNMDEDFSMLDDEMRPLNDDDYQQAAQFASRNSVAATAKYKMKPKPKQPAGQDLTSEMNITTEMPGDPTLLPTKILPRPQKPPVKKRTKQSQSTPMPSSPKLPPMLHSDANYDMSTQAGLPVSQREPSAPRPLTAEPLNQSRPRSESMSKSLSEAPGGSSRGQNQKSIRRKEIIVENLQKAIASGGVPKYCANCGELETPSWRKCFVKLQLGEELTDAIIAKHKGPGMCVRAVGDPDPKTSLFMNYRIYKRTATKEDRAAGFDDSQLCNPCGIHFNKYDEMRPNAMWAKTKKAEENSKKRKRSKKAAADSEQGGPVAGPESESGTPYPVSDFPSGRSDRSIAKSTGRGGQSQPNSGRSDRSEPKSVTGSRLADNVLQRTMSDPSGNGTELADNMAMLQRAIQSSPPRIAGSKNSPIEIDDEARSPNPTRRLLFPSPGRAGHMKTLDGFCKTDSKTAPTAPAKATEDPFNTMPRGGAADSAELEVNKENVPPAPVADDDLSYLFEGSPFKRRLGTPKTPKRVGTPRSASQHSDPFRTPTRSSAKMLRGVLTSAARQFKNGNAETPSRAMALEGLDLADMTPSTRRLTSMITGSDDFGGELADLSAFDFDAVRMDEFDFGQLAGGSLVDVFDEEAWAQSDAANMNGYTGEQTETSEALRASDVAAADSAAVDAEAANGD